MDVDAISSLGHQVHVMVVSSTVETFSERDFNTRVTLCKGNGQKDEQSKSWSKSVGQGKGKEGDGYGTSSGNFKESTSAKGSYKGKRSKGGLSGLENPKSQTCQETLESAQMYSHDNSHTDHSWFADGWNDAIHPDMFSLRQIPLKWKEHKFHKGSFSNYKPILDNGVWA